MEPHKRQKKLYASTPCKIYVYINNCNDTEFYFTHDVFVCNQHVAWNVNWVHSFTQSCDLWNIVWNKHRR